MSTAPGDKIICIGKNYADHVKEMAAMLGDAAPERPVIFLKPFSVLREASQGQRLELRLPPEPGQIHHECEIVLRLGRGGFRLSPSEAEAAIESVTLGLDMTRRDWQAAAKKQGQPWTVSKVFLDAAVVGPWRPVKGFSSYLETPFRFHLDGELRQEGLGNRMLTSPVAAIVHASQCFPLCAGDLLFTGTPSGVGPVVAGQVASLEWGNIRYTVAWSPYR